MAAKHPRRPTDLFPLLLLVILVGRCVESQSPSSGSKNSTGNSNDSGEYISGHFNPYTVIIIVVLISAFFLLGFFSIYIRQCGDRLDNFGAPAVNAATAVRLRLQRGLRRDVLESLPTLVYSEVKEHKIGKGALECAICLNEFEDDETIRLLPNCDHVFHQECIDAWLNTHVTCPVCRTNYADYSLSDFSSRVTDGENFDAAPTQAAFVPDAPATDDVVNLVDDVEERKEEMRELARLASRVRGNGGRRSGKLSRSYSTGHFMTPKGEVGHDRYTLRLPENVRKEILSAGRLKRARTFGAVGGAGEGSMRRISRGGGEASSRRNRTIRLGRSDRWPSFFGRSLSAKLPAWGKGSGSRKMSGVKPTVDCFGGGSAAAGGSKNYADVESDEASTAPLNRV